jgi:hypothetical protein
MKSSRGNQPAVEPAGDETEKVQTQCPSIILPKIQFSSEIRNQSEIGKL